MEEFQYSSIMQVPRLVKICLNQGVGEATQDKKLVDAALKEMTMIAGQKAVPTKARLSVSNFKLREGMIIGARVTLRKDRMSITRPSTNCPATPLPYASTTAANSQAAHVDTSAASASVAWSFASWPWMAKSRVSPSAAGKPYGKFTANCRTGPKKTPAVF